MRMKTMPLVCSSVAELLAQYKVIIWFGFKPSWQ